MDFDLSEEQRMLQASVQRLLREGTASWAQFADLGLLGLPFAEADGGLGGSAVDTFLVMEEMGRALCPLPYLAGVVLCGGLLRATGTAAQFAPAIAAGELKLAFAHSEAQARFDLADVRATATRRAGGWVLDGAKRFVLGGDVADRLLVSARCGDEIGLFVTDTRDAGLRRRSYRLQDGTGAADFALQAATATRLVEGDALPAIERAVDIATAALCAEAVGAMSQALETTVDYLKVRKQFGVTIGSFQALQHRAVDMLVATEQARSMALYATMMCEAPDAGERSRAMSAAKVQVNQSGRFVGQEAVQLHGGIGMTEECRVGHYLRRLTMLEMLFGDTAHHLRRLG